MALRDGRFAGQAFRALNPVYARKPLSGYGAQLHGGRFNPKGMAALYLALDPATALREANQVGALQPTVLVAYRADIGPVFDTGDAAALRARGMTGEGLADAGWRAAMLAGRAVPTQAFALRLVAEGFAGLLVRSFARGAGAGAGGLNLVLWRWAGEGCALEVVDDEDRLGRM